MMGERRQLVAWVLAGTVFLSAFLLFQVQPLISKAILPWFGGSPSVWTTCMIFFQSLLVAGYAYAHALNRSPNRWRNFLIHAILLLAAASLLPVVPGVTWKPSDGQHPVVRILLLLAATVGLPYLMLASSGPLLQTWFSQLFPDRSPYRLYALSNAGSLLALLTYPWFVETNLSLQQQGWWWGLLFLCYAAAGICLNWIVASRMPVDEPLNPAIHHDQPAPIEWLHWVALPALATIALLSVTNHLCRDVAVVPFLWIAPLVIYLFSFIATFEWERFYSRRSWSRWLVLATLLVVATFFHQELQSFAKSMGLEWQISRWLRKPIVEIPICLLWLFCICLVCHGEAVSRKPPAYQATRFYLSLSAGGAIGGIFVGILCPMIMNHYWEFHGSLFLGALLAATILSEELTRFRSPNSRFQKVFSKLLPMGTVLAGATLLPTAWNDPVLARKRGFYGVISVRELDRDRPLHHGRGLYNGKILHGFQFLDPSRKNVATTYYGPSSAPDAVIQYLKGNQKPLRIGVIGLGVGTIATYLTANDHLCYYEIDPLVIEIQDEFFTYYKDCPANKQIVLGDARIQMERQEPKEFDAIFVDAFSGDAIPVHLLTVEAMDVYEKHLAIGGVVAFHISNRYLNLHPVIDGLATSKGLHSIRLHTTKSDGFHTTASDWIVLTKDPLLEEQPPFDLLRIPPDSSPPLLWTDQSSSLWDVLR
jgi:hypothetical protein